MTHSRITVVDKVYHQSPDNDPTSTEVGYTRSLASDEQPYRRTTTIGEQWAPLECGWFEKIGKAGLLVLLNEPTKFQTVPTSEELAAAQARVIEVALQADSGMWADGMPAFAILYPGEDARFTPANLPLLRVRCQSGTARLTVCLFPH